MNTDSNAEHLTEPQRARLSANGLILYSCTYILLVGLPYLPYGFAGVVRTTITDVLEGFIPGLSYGVIQFFCFRGLYPHYASQGRSLSKCLVASSLIGATFNTSLYLGHSFLALMFLMFGRMPLDILPSPWIDLNELLPRSTRPDTETAFAISFLVLKYINDVLSGYFAGRFWLEKSDHSFLPRWKLPERVKARSLFLKVLGSLNFLFSIAPLAWSVVMMIYMYHARAMFGYWPGGDDYDTPHDMWSSVLGNCLEGILAIILYAPVIWLTLTVLLWKRYTVRQKWWLTGIATTGIVVFGALLLVDPHGFVNWWLYPPW